MADTTPPAPPVDHRSWFDGIDRGVMPPEQAQAFREAMLHPRSPTVAELEKIADDLRRRTSCRCPVCGVVAAARVRLEGDRVQALDAECYFCEWRGVVLR